MNTKKAITGEKTWVVQGRPRIGTSNCWNDEIVIAEGLSSHEAADAVAAASVGQGAVKIKILSVPPAVYDSGDK
jgi:hypothetical protein